MYQTSFFQTYVIFCLAPTVDSRKKIRLKDSFRETPIFIEREINANYAPIKVGDKKSFARVIRQLRLEHIRMYTKALNSNESYPENFQHPVNHGSTGT